MTMRRGTVMRQLATGVAAWAMIAGVPAWAQPAATEAAESYAIPAEPLPDALAAWSARSGIRVQSMPDAARQVRAAETRGAMTAVAALDALLQGTGYSFRFSRVDAVVIEAIPTGGLADAIGTVRVQGTTVIATQGVNGSTDPTATEGSDSYAADQTTIASKSPMAIKDVPQSISVVTRQQLLDRNVTDFQRALMEGPGISTVYGSSTGQNAGRNNLQPTFFSRGFEISRLQIDGGAPIDITQYSQASLVPELNMAAYDHIEILRGADGLFNGQGSPGGVINLARKRPLDRQQLLISQLVESYNSFDTTIDGSSPIGFDGNLRARIVLDRQSKHYFYDTAKSKSFMFYGILEAQITPSTLLSGGVNYQSQQAVPFYNGLPAGLVDGEIVDLRLPRSTCFCFESNHTEYDTRDAFVSLAQSFGPNWTLTIKGDAIRQKSSYSYLSVVGIYGSPDPNQQPRLNDSFGQNASTQYTLDSALSGAFNLFGERQIVTMGANFSSFDGGGATAYASDYRFVDEQPLVDVLNFDPSDFAAPAHTSQPVTYTPISRSQNLGAYAKLVLTPWKPLHLTVGMRYNRFSGRNHTYNVCRSEFGCFDFVTGNFVDDGAIYGDSDTGSSTSKFFPAGYLGAAFDLTQTLSAYVSRTAIYIDNSLSGTTDDKPLAPTTGDNYEGGLKYASADHRLTASIAAFYLRQRGFPFSVSSVGVPGVDASGKFIGSGRLCCYVSDPDSERRSKGFDLEIAGEILPGLQVSTSYTYNHTKNISGPLNPVVPLDSQVPEHLYRAWVRYGFQPGSALHGGYIGLGLQGQSSGGVGGQVCTEAFVFGCLTYTNFTVRQPPRALVSLQAGWEFRKQLSIAATVNNLFDKRYYAGLGIENGGNWYGQPRAISVTLRGAF